MSVGELNLIVIGLLCVVGFIVVGIDSRRRKRRLRRSDHAENASR